MGFLKSTLSINIEDMKVSLTRSPMGTGIWLSYSICKLLEGQMANCCERIKASQSFSLVPHSHTPPAWKEEEYTVRKRFAARINLEVCGLKNACMPIVVKHTVNITSRIQTLGRYNVCSYTFSPEFGSFQ